MRQPNARNVKIQDLSYLVRMFHVLLTLLFLLTSVRSSLAGTTCDAVDGFDYRGAMIKKIPVSQAYFYTITRMAIDADGAPNSYHPLDKGIDALANAGFPERNWKAILVENPTKSDEPFVQTGGEFAGFFVSRTTLQDRSLALTDVRRYVDSTRVP